MTTKQEKTARSAEAYEESILPLTADQLAELEEQRKQAIARDAERSRAYRDQVRGLPAPVEIAGD